MMQEESTTEGGGGGRTPKLHPPIPAACRHCTACVASEKMSGEIYIGGDDRQIDSQSEKTRQAKTEAHRHTHFCGELVSMDGVESFGD